MRSGSYFKEAGHLEEVRVKTYESETLVDFVSLGKAVDQPKDYYTIV